MIRSPTATIGPHLRYHLSPRQHLWHFYQQSDNSLQHPIDKEIQETFLTFLLERDGYLRAIVENLSFSMAHGLILMGAIFESGNRPTKIERKCEEMLMYFLIQ